MELLLLLIAALAPVGVLLWYINNKDKNQPEPTGWLVKAFGYGVVSILLTFVILVPIEAIFGSGSDTDEYASVFDAFANAFLSAAIPEELAKFIMLWLLLRKNPYFDEKFDSLVYAVCVGMGFAGIENIMYLIEGLEDGSWVTTGISRALFSIPGHFLFAILMGYYYSRYHFGIDRSAKTKAMILVAPILAHGIYDGILFSLQVDEGIAVIGMLLFLYFFNKLRKKGKEKIHELMENPETSKQEK